MSASGEGVDVQTPAARCAGALAAILDDGDTLMPGYLRDAALKILDEYRDSKGEQKQLPKEVPSVIWVEFVISGASDHCAIRFWTGDYERARTEIADGRRLRGFCTFEHPPTGNPDWADHHFLRHCAKVMRGTIDNCRAKPQKSYEDATEEHGEICLAELAVLATTIERGVDWAPPGVNRITEDALWRLLPNDNRYLDPPDGGNVPLIEQLKRMAEDANKWVAACRTNDSPK